jgi:hypothetical protein
VRPGKAGQGGLEDARVLFVVRRQRMAQTAAHLVECVIPWVSTRQWVVSVPIPLRYWMSSSQALTAQIHTVIRTTIGQYYVNRAVVRGDPQAKVQPGSVTFSPQSVFIPLALITAVAAGVVR